MNGLNASPGHQEAIHGLSFRPDDGWFATASDSATIRTRAVPPAEDIPVHFMKPDSGVIGFSFLRFLLWRWRQHDCVS